MNKSQEDPNNMERRSLLKGTTALLALNTAAPAAASPGGMEIETVAQTAPEAAIPQKRPAAREIIKITKIDTFLVKPRWLFLKIHTNAGITGLGEPILEGRALTCAQAVKEVESYLLGKDPRAAEHHWQAIYRHAFYRGGPILTSALSGIDQALWDIKGKGLGVPRLLHEMREFPLRHRFPMKGSE